MKIRMLYGAAMQDINVWPTSWCRATVYFISCLLPEHRTLPLRYNCATRSAHGVVVAEP